MEMKKKEFRVQKKQVITVSILILLIILISIIELMQSINKNKTQISPELARAMTYGELTTKDEETQSEYVRFSSYFARDLDSDGYAEKVKGTCKEVEGEDTLYMSLNVLGNGYLKDGKIEIESNNIYFKTALVEDEIISGNYISENTKEINLKEVTAGTQKLIFGQVRTGDYRYTTTKKDALGKDTNKLSGINKIKLTGVHVTNEGVETKIEKEIEIPVDWYSTTKAEIPYTYGANKEKNKYQNYNTESIVDEVNQEVNLEFKITSQESNNKLLLKKSTIEGTIPELNGYKATNVEITGENVQYTYDQETGNFTAYRKAQIGEDGVVTKEAYTSSYNTARYSEYKLKVTYPLVAYKNSSENGTIVLNIPVKATFEGYNNPNEEFNNPYVSNVAEDVISITYERGGGDVISYDIQVGTWVSNPYNVYVISKENAVGYYNQMEEATKDTYEVRWYVARGNSGEISNVQLREQDNNYTDKFLKTDGTYEDMLKYSKNIGIYFTTPGAMFGEDGWIRVYNDETDQLIHEFTKDDWESYTKENPYYYDQPVAHIRIETSSADRVSSFTATNIKELDNELLTTDKTREEFDKLSKINSYLSGYAKLSENEEYQKIKDDIGIANYDEPISMAQINNVTPITLSTQETTNVKITIGTVNLGYNVILWKNGTFLLKFPEEVLLAEINNVTINNGNVEILGYDIYEQDGNYYLKILTENENPENYTITVDADITPDPRKLSATRNIELYAYNEECNNYKEGLRAEDIYDINANGNTTDLVDYSKKSISFVGPTSLLTTETGSDYNEEGDEVKTTIAPQVAIIDKAQNNRTAKISVQILNNYSGNISGVVVVGKTPFEGNKSQILEKDLGSTFTASMTGPIQLPEKLQGIATVYYSENETVNNNISDASNNWKTESEVTDFSKIRTYAIDLGDYVIAKGEEYICTYEIEVPQEVNYNDVTYSTHAVYFYLETDEGKLRDQTETNKLGFMIAKKYNLELTKVKQGTNTPIQGASFSVQAEGEESSRIIISDSNGKINIQDLYVEKIYTVKEIKAPSDYILNEEEIKFRTTVGENGELIAEKIEGNVNINVEQANTENLATVNFVVENEPKYTLKLNKEDEQGEKIQGIRFNLTGKGLSTGGRTVTTNSKGELIITGLYPNEEYTLTEVYAEGYEYNEAPIRFKTVWNGNNLEAQVTEGSFKEQPTVDNSQEKHPIMSATVVNTKLNDYTLYLVKSEKGTTKQLEGAVFNIQGKWLNDNFTTDEYGAIEVGPLYEGIEYILTEVTPPEGYALSDNTVRFVVKKNEEGKAQLQILEGEIKSLEYFETEEGYALVKPEPAIDKDGNPIEGKYAFANSDENGIFKIDIALDNEPLFSLMKVDGETQAPLPNVKFAITKVEDDGTETPATNSKGELIGEETEVDGKTYQIITTDKDGKITEDLPEGYYKVVEIETLEGYKLPENEEEKTYFFGIGKTKPEEKELIELWSQTYEGNGEIDVTTCIATTDGGYLIAGTITGRVVLEAEKTVDNKAIEIINKAVSGGDGILIKYNAEDKIEWAKKAYGFTYETPQNVVEVEDGYLVTYMGKSMKIPQEETVNNIEINIQTNDFDFITIKYNKEGLAEWGVSTFGNKAEYPYYVEATPDGGFIVAGYWQGDTLTIPADKVANNQEIIINNKYQTANWKNGIIIKYNSDNLIEWATHLNGKNSNNVYKIIPVDNENGLSYIVLYDGQDLVLDKEQIDGNISTLEYSGRNKGIIKINEKGKIEKVDIATDSSNITPQIFLNEDNSFVLLKNGTITLYDENAEIIKSNQFLNMFYYRGLIKSNSGNYIAIASTNTNINIDGKYTQEGQNIQLTNISVGTNDIVLISINEDFLIEKATIIGTKGDEDFKEIIQKNNGEYMLPVNMGNTKLYLNNEEKQEIDKGFNIIKLTDIDEISDVSLMEIVASGSQYYSSVETNNGGQITVGTITGYLNIKTEDTSDNEEINLLSNGNTDLLITKYSMDGKVDWAINLGTTGADVLNSIIKKDDIYIAVGQISGDLHIDKKYTYSGEDIDITSSGNKGVIIEFNENGKVVTVKVATGGNSNFKTISNDNNGGYTIGVTAYNNFSLEGEELNDLKGSSMILIEFNPNNTIERLTNLYMTAGSVGITRIASLSDGGIIVVGGVSQNEDIIPGDSTTIGEITIPQTKGSADGFIVRLNTDRKIEFLKVIQPQNAASLDVSNDIVETDDGGYILLWDGYTGTGIEFTEEETVSGEVIRTTMSGWYAQLIKFDSNNKVEWIEWSNQNTKRIINTSDKGYILVTNHSSMHRITKYNSKFEQEYKLMESNGRYNDIIDNGDNTYTVFGYQTENSIDTAKIAKFQENTISAEIPEQQEITVENYKKEHKITAEVKGEGGTISGQGSTTDNPYEIVKHGDNSTKDIIAIPEPGYKVLKITVNDEEIAFTSEKDGSVILDKFINMTNDKHVVVEFSNTVSAVIVHHYKDGTEEKLSEDETLTGEIGANYTTSPKTDIEGYEVVVEKLPSNASGEYTEDVQEVNYYYKQIPAKLIVNHYLEGTEEIVPGSENEQINEEREKGTEYTTTPAQNIDPKYELVEMPSNSTGTLTENETVVTYYYRVKDSAGVIVHHIDTDTKEQIAPDVVIPSNGIGKYGDSYTTEVSSEIPINYKYITRTDNWEGTMIDKLTEVTYEYKMVDPTITNKIEKTATQEITKIDDVVTYNITYSANVEDYIGKAQITIVDVLPYAIDTSKSILNGGTYNPDTNTITWQEVVNGIDTYANPESGNIEINKTIKVVYMNLDTTKETIENNVSGKVKLLTSEKTSEEVTDTATTDTKIMTNIIVKYLEKDDTPNDNSDNKVVAPEETIEGYIGKEYTTQQKDIAGYTFIESTDNTEGTMTKDPIEVIYYYAQNTKVVVKYLEKDDTPGDNTDNKVLAPAEIIEGYEGKEYKTEQKEITNYTFVESTNNTEGTMTKDIIEVIYYYLQNTKATVQHIDRETGEILKEETEDGKVGDLFETHAEDFEGYILVESPEEPNIIMDETGEQVVRYYYAHVSAGVIEKHIDDITGELLYSEEHQGNEGDSYNIPSKTFEGYDLVTEDKEGNSRLPDNAEGTMKRDEVIEVKYYYIKKAKVVIKYLEEDDTPEDTTDNKVLAEEETIEGHENDSYETESKDIKDYNLVGIPENAKGTMTITKNQDGTYNTEIEVIYYYKKQAGGVIENHIDITTNEKLATEEHTGNVGDEYDIPSREFEGYDLVIDKLPTNAKGEMTEEPIEVNYYYIKQAKVEVEYIDKQTGEKLDEDELKGHIGDSYETEEKNFDNYELIEIPDNTMGEMTEDTIVVKYYYRRKAEVEVQYVEKNTNHQLAESDNIEGYVGDEYKTQSKDITYYKLVGQTENTEGTMERDKITVIYYYEKQVFNLSVDKWVSNVSVNGINQGGRNINSKDEIYKVDIHRSKTETANIKITYKIRVTNKGEIEGTAGEIVEIIPEGYSYYQEDNKVQWEERNGTLITDALKNETIKIGEYKEIEIVLRWDKGEDNFGQKDNFVIIGKMNNPAGYEDISKEDNKSKSSMIITVATGLDRNDRIAIIGIVQIVLVITIGLLFSYKKKEKK